MLSITRKIIFALFVCMLSITCAYAASNRFFVPGKQTEQGQKVEEGLQIPQSSMPMQKENQAAATEPAQEKTLVEDGLPTRQDDVSRLGQQRKDVEGEPLRIPQPVENMEFAAGNWSFDHLLKGANGEDLAVDFFFDNNGRGALVIRDSENNRYLAQSMARSEDGALFVQTGPFVNPVTGKGFNALYISCENSADGAICTGTDGFGAWTGERLLKNNPSAHAAAKDGAANSEQSDAQKAYAQSRNQKTVQGQAQPDASGKAAKDLAELSAGGAELSPVIMENAQKAMASDKKLSAASLAGDWIYSQELARQSDGKGLSLGFSFDREGKGFSFIDDGTDKPFQAKAETQLMPNGSLRVRTDAYSRNGKEGYYPTFMECARAANGELECDISNGWARIEGGRLVAQKSVQEGQKNIQVQDILDMGQQSPQESASEAKGRNMADILGDMSDMPAQEAESRASGKAENERKQAGKKTASLSLPVSGNSLDFLEGRWRCNTGLANATTNEPVVVEFTFNNHGKGSALVRERNGHVFQASANAVFKGGKLRINTSDYRSRTIGRRYEKSFIECVDKGRQAICSGVNGNIHWAGATFTRLK